MHDIYGDDDDDGDDGDLLQTEYLTKDDQWKPVDEVICSYVLTRPFCFLGKINPQERNCAVSVKVIAFLLIR